ncbi:MAG: helix-turn-helix domain-containing protein [Micavibrio sp.]
MTHKKKSRVSEDGRVIAENLKTLRDCAGLSQADIAGFLGVSYQQVQKYEAGINRIPLQLLPPLCDALGVPVEAFFSGVHYGQEKPDSEWRDMQASFARVRSADMRRKIIGVIDILSA